MKKIMLATTMLLIGASTAIAQAAPAEKLKIEVTGPELQVIGQALGKIPYEVAKPVIETLQSQIDAADKQAAAKAAADAITTKDAEKGPKPSKK